MKSLAALVAAAFVVAAVWGASAAEIIANLLAPLFRVLGGNANVFAPILHLLGH